MIEHQTTIRLRDGETNKMGYVHHSNYPSYLEEARMELLQKIGLNYGELEDSGIVLSVVSMNIRYSSPVYFDELLTINSKLELPPEIKLIFHYEIFNQLNKLVFRAETTSIFVNLKTRKPIWPPKEYLKNFEEVVEI